MSDIVEVEIGEWDPNGYDCWTFYAHRGGAQPKVSWWDGEYRQAFTLEQAREFIALLTRACEEAERE